MNDTSLSGLRGQHTRVEFVMDQVDARRSALSGGQAALPKAGRRTYVSMATSAVAMAYQVPSSWVILLLG